MISQDRRSLSPPGSEFVDAGIVVMSMDPDMTIALDGSKKIPITVSRGKPPLLTGSNTVLPVGTRERMMENYKENQISEYSHAHQDVVFFCGGGPSLYKDIGIIESNRDKMCVVTANQAQTKIEGDYCIVCESRDEFLGPVDTGNTVGHFVTTVAPGTSSLPWKDVSWYSHNHEFESGHLLPKYHTGRHVTFDALQFAIETLGAKKVIISGAEYIYGTEMDVENARLIEGLAVLYSKDVEIWNVSGHGIFTHGVILGTAEEAINGN